MIRPLIDTLRMEDIDDDVYFSEKYSGYISNSRLSLINPNQDGSPEKFFDGLSAHKLYLDSLIFGSAVHGLSLQPESYELIDCVDRPTAKTGFIADIVYNKDGIMPTDEQLIEAAVEVDYYHGILTENKMSKLKESITEYLKTRAEFEKDYDFSKVPIYLDPKNREKLNACMVALESNNRIQELLHPKGIITEPVVGNEKTILMDIEVTPEGEDPVILRLKSKLDNFTIDFENNTIYVNDIKTTGKMLNEFDKAIDAFHYFRELAMYSWLLSLVAEKYYGMKDPTIKGNFLVVSTIPNYYTKVVPMTKGLYLKGFNEFKELLTLVAKYKNAGW